MATKSKGKKPRKAPSPAQLRAQAEFKRRVASGDPRFRRGGGSTIRPEGRQTDPTPTIARPEPLGSAFTFRINSVPVIRLEPRDKIAIGTALLFAMRSAGSGLLDPDAAEAQEILATWFKDASLSEILPAGVDLRDEVRMWHEVFRIMPQVAQRMSFSAEEWVNTFNAIMGPTMGSLPAGPPVSAGLDGMYPPVRGTVEESFAPPLNLGVRIAATAGTPIIAPEDLLVTAVKTDVGSIGNHLLAVSRNPDTGEYPGVVGGGPIDAIVPHQGTRLHTIGGFGTFAAGLKRGDKVERGAQIGVVNAGGRSVEWRVRVWVPDRDGKVKLTPMDPGDLVPVDVLAGAAAVRPPSPTWTIVDPKDPAKTTESPSYNIWIGGDVISKGGKVATGDIDILSAPVETENEFNRLDAGNIVEKLLGGTGRAVGTFYGGKQGGDALEKVGRGLGKIGTDVVSDFVRQR